ncbi:uncharacterized protein RJT20DRAFT_133001 [Scheffersomyces xylosifermentans]|uniref:uncharacterized protein n=1 Tax=Scheffersomyces xylosifermentans TaxID=1304137 RepID=UPI00315CDB9B
MAATYAEAAAEALDNPPHETNVPQNKVPADQLEKLKKDAKDVTDDAIKKVKEASEDLKKELNELEKEGKSLWAKFISSVESAASSLKSSLSDAGATVQSTASSALTTTSKELQNPVVLIQALVGAGGIAAGYLVATERHRIDFDNKVVVGVHAAVITGLVLLDGYLFNTYYPKYDKKTL